MSGALGGGGVRRSWLPYGRHEVDDEDVAAVVEALRSPWITQGARVAEFEQAVARMCDAAHAVAFSNGTAALHAACAAASLGPGLEAITTPLTFAATANAALYCGAKVSFADIRPDTLNIDPESVERRITERTRAILPVDFAGQPADMDRLVALARRHHLVLIEDAAHALGARWRGRPIGSLADMTVFSFHPVKHITTGEGGMVMTNDAGLAERLRTFRHHGIVHPDPERPWCYEIAELGHNYRITDIQCALGLAQLRKLSAWQARRRALAARYRKVLADVDGVSLPDIAEGAEHAWHIFVVLLDPRPGGPDRDAVIAALRATNIGATLHYPLVHLHPYFRKHFGFGPGLCPAAEAVGPRLLTLPLFPAMTEADVDDIVGQLRAVLELG